MMVTIECFAPDRCHACSGELPSARNDGLRQRCGCECHGPVSVPESVQRWRALREAKNAELREQRRALNAELLAYRRRGF